MKRTKTRTKKKRSGVDRLRLAAALVLTCCVLLAGGAHRKDPGAYALLGGTVFREPGLALAGATVVLTAADGGKHARALKTVSDNRGEFAFRLPPVAARYLVRASAKGFQPQEKQAEVSDPQERVDINFILVSESKQEQGK